MEFVQDVKIWGSQSHKQQRQLDHKTSKLPAAKFDFAMEQDKLIEKTKAGELGSTEVPSKQIW